MNIFKIIIFPKKIGFDTIYRKELEEDTMGSILDDFNGFYHCRICNQTFPTKSDKHFIPQWLSHKSSGKHRKNKKNLIQKLVK